MSSQHHQETWVRAPTQKTSAQDHQGIERQAVELSLVQTTTQDGECREFVIILVVMEDRRKISKKILGIVNLKVYQIFEHF